MKARCLLLILLVYISQCSVADETKPHKLVKRQVPPRPGLRAFPLSRSRQFPPPEELEESEEYVYSEEEEEDKNAASPFRGRQPQQPPPEEEFTDDYSYTEAPKKTTPAPQKPTARTVIFNNRFAARPRFGSVSSTSATTTTTTTPTPKTPAASTSRSRFRATPAQSQRLDVVANILNKPPPPRPLDRSFSSARTSNLNDKKPVSSSSEAPTRRTTSRPRARGRFRTRTSTSTTTTTTTTEQPLEEYYYYYEDEEDQKNQPIATTTSTTTTTTPKPSLPKRVSIGRRPSSGRSQSTAKPVVKFDPESQFVPPPEDVAEIFSESSYSTKKFTTSSTTTPVPGSAADAIPAHLRSKYKPRKDGRFIDFLRDPNRPRELKGFDLTDYPFYVKVPEDIDFECEDKKDGYYASIPHKCQLFHYCFAGARYDFLCANYTLYDQTTFTCRFANNVDCPSSAKYYYRNDDLWKETTTPAPETTTPKKRRTTPKEDDYDDYYDYDEYDEEEEERRRRPAKRRRNRRKNRRKPQESEKR